MKKKAHPSKTAKKRPVRLNNSDKDNKKSNKSFHDNNNHNNKKKEKKKEENISYTIKATAEGLFPLRSEGRKSKGKGANVNVVIINSIYGNAKQLKKDIKTYKAGYVSDAITENKDGSYSVVVRESSIEKIRNFLIRRGCVTGLNKKNKGIAGQIKELEKAKKSSSKQQVIKSFPNKSEVDNMKSKKLKEYIKEYGLLNECDGKNLAGKKKVVKDYIQQAKIQLKIHQVPNQMMMLKI